MYIYIYTYNIWMYAMTPEQVDSGCDMLRSSLSFVQYFEWPFQGLSKSIRTACFKWLEHWTMWVCWDFLHLWWWYDAVRVEDWTYIFDIFKPPTNHENEAGTSAVRWRSPSVIEHHRAKHHFSHFFHACELPISFGTDKNWISMRSPPIPNPCDFTKGYLEHLEYSSEATKSNGRNAKETC